MVELAHRAGAQRWSTARSRSRTCGCDVQALDADFFVFSGHKIFGPTGIGVVYGKREVLDDMPPWQGGGNMIADVTFERTVYQAPPARFEAGTGNIADAVGLGAALEYVERIGIENIAPLRARAARVRHAGAWPSAGAAADRHRARQGQRAVLRARRLHAPTKSARR
ncbi:MAG: aminotransferase class V-fold PLP-dependent enzyme [Rubrivivax sp.]